MPSVKYVAITSKERLMVDASNEKFTFNYRDTVTQLLGRIQDSKEEKTVRNMHSHSFSFRRIDGLWFACVADDSFGKQMPFIFLQDVADTFKKTYPDLSTTDAVTIRAFTDTLVDKIAQYSSADEMDKVTRVEKGVDDLKDIVKGNIEHAVRASADIDSLVSQTDGLRGRSDKFVSQSKALHSRLCWNNIKIKFFAIALILIILYFFVASFCGLNFKYC